MENWKGKRKKKVKESKKKLLLKDRPGMKDGINKAGKKEEREKATDR
jgi:hypothetical protein